MLDLVDRAHIGLINVGARKPASYDVVLPTSEAPIYFVLKCLKWCVTLLCLIVQVI